jgi:hypothetical protein
MEQRFTTLNESVEQRFTTLEQSMEQRFTTLNESVEQRFTTLEQSMEQTIDRLTKYIDERLQLFEQTITGSSSIVAASNTAVRIEISPGSLDRNNTMASGNLISIAGMCYVSTCRHVLVDNESLPRTIESLRLVDNTTLKVSGTCSFSSKWDLALVPVSCPGNRTPLTVAHEEPKVGTRLFGMSHRPHGLVLLPCSILEKRVKTYETDCPGTHGFSGTGYLNGEGTLIALHSGSGMFGHLNDWRSDLESMNSSFDFDWTRARTICTEAWQTQKEVGKCFSRLRELIEVTARNPRTRVVSAVHLRKLANK